MADKRPVVCRGLSALKIVQSTNPIPTTLLEVEPLGTFDSDVVRFMTPFKEYGLGIFIYSFTFVSTAQFGTRYDFCSAV